MGNNLFGANISGVIAKAIGPGILPASLIKVVAGTRDPSNLSGPSLNSSTTSHAARGFIDDYSAFLIDGTRIKTGDRRVMLLGDTIADNKIPVQSDRVVIEGVSWLVIKVDRDPDAATYTLQVRQ